MRELPSWRMPLKDKDALLVDAVLNANSQTGAEVLRRFDLSRKVCPDSKTQSKRRTVGELLEAARRRSDEKARQRAKRQAVEQARQAQEAAKTRARYLDQLAEREQATWENVTTLVHTKQPGKYDLADYIPTHEEVRRMTAMDASSWSEAIIAEREERF